MKISKNDKMCVNCNEKPIIGCNCKESWKNITCGIVCFQQYMLKQEGKIKMKALFRIEDNNLKTDSIVEYDFDKMEFKSEYKTYKLEDIRTFMIPKDELIKILHIDNSVSIKQPEAIKETIIQNTDEAISNIKSQNIEEQAEEIGYNNEVVVEIDTKPSGRRKK